MNGRLWIACLLAFFPRLMLAEIWHVKAPPTAYRAKDVHQDFRGFTQLGLSVQRLGPAPETPLLLSLYLQNKQGDWIECRADLVLDGTAQRFDLSLGDLSGDWRVANANRPFGIDQVRDVTRWGLRLYTARPWEGAIEVGPLETRRGTELKPEPRPRPLPEQFSQGLATAIDFETLHFAGDPFDPAWRPSVLLVQGGHTQTFPAAWVQDYRERRAPGVADSRWVAWRRPVFRAQVVPERAGPHEVFACLGDARVPMGTVQVGGPVPAPAPTGSEPSPEWSRPFPAGTVWRSDGEEWVPAQAETLWTPDLDWTAAWGSFLGLGHFAQEPAARFEAALASSRATGPLVIASEQILQNHGRHNWQDHPWNKANGGNLEHPSDLWRDPRWADLAVRRARYLWHRYGAAPQVTGLYLDVTRASPEAVAWIENLAERLRAELPGVDILCPSPGLPARRTWWTLDPIRGWRGGGSTRVITESNRLDAVFATRLPGVFEATLPGMRHWRTAPVLRVDLTPDYPLETASKVQVHLRTDPKTLWESKLHAAHNRESNRIFIPLADPAQWSCLTEPGRAWTPLERMNIRSLTLRVFQDEDFGDAKVLLASLAIVDAPDALRPPLPPLGIRPARTPGEQVRQFEKMDWVFDLTRDVHNPYDPAEIRVDLEVELPDGRLVSQPAYFDQDVGRAMVAGKETWTLGTGTVWRVRFRPWLAGAHRWSLVARHHPVPEGEAEDVRLEGTFVAEAQPASRGFVRISSDPRYFEFSNGEFFFPIGHTLRSPSDRRKDIFEPALTPNLDESDALGTGAYERFFSRMAAQGANFARVWITSWWLGLEWSHDYEGFHGRGYFNQANAARLDRLIDLAETHGVYLNLETMNHGALSTTVDQEWEDNPWSEWSADHGPVRYASDFFTHPEATAGHRNKLRYMQARWGHSPSLIWWGVTTESEWIEPYFRYIGREPRRATAVHPQPFVSTAYHPALVNWVAETATFLTDTAQPHLATVHFSQPRHGNEMWSIPSLQIIHNNAYNGFYPGTPPLQKPSRAKDHPLTRDIADGSGDRMGAGRRMGGFPSDAWDGVVADIFGYDRFFSGKHPDKLIMVGEWGGSPHRNRETHLLVEFHTGLWASLMTRLSGASGYWWWNIVDHHDLYPHYRGVTRFMQGEDRRGKDLVAQRLVVGFASMAESRPAPTRLSVGVSNARELQAYVYPTWISSEGNTRMPRSFDDARFPPSGEGVLLLPDTLENGHYQVEFWNTFEGEVFERKDLWVKDDVRELTLPSHRVDLALKLKYQGPLPEEAAPEAP